MSSRSKPPETAGPEEPGRAGAGRQWVRASAAAPREALSFLGRRHHRGRSRPPAGSVPGSMVVPADAPTPSIRAFVYGPDEATSREVDDVESLSGLVGAGAVTWIDVEGFGDARVLEGVGRILGIHPLAMADVVHVPQRPKAELHDGHLLVVTHMANLDPQGRIGIEQVAFVLGPGWVVSFQCEPGDVFDPVRERIRTAGSRIRREGADYLLYALVDAVVDGYFPVVEALSDVIEALEEEVVERPGRTALARIHATRRTLLTLHRVQWRQRDAVGVLLRDETLPLSPGVRPYLRDVHDHAFQTLDAIETCRDMVTGLMDLHLSSASHRLNEVMKTLTIVATIFIPLTFMAGVYGMNFDFMPELRWRWGYPAFWLGMLAIAGGLAFWFRRRGWLGGGPP